MGDILEIFTGLGFFLNPIFAIVFFINLVEINKKLIKGNESDISKNVLWFVISGTYIVTILTWMFGFPK
ncbi:hypothetical protein [Lysinibacillus telephonicus]|uniref:PCZ2.2 n=1 Tax=Lysinibacillus telephonicus TaxID=1714840 RepID=A0A431UBV4_9BACI|nr:hypothetical protein [Lysinibacillus telephonicus]RTQ86032.1 hypothetical protein EKG35_20460 [Lysinibacillus telephonicus]